MKKSTRIVIDILVSAATLAGLVAIPAIAQDKAKDSIAVPVTKVEKGKATQKPLFENDKVRVFEITFKPGDAGAINAIRPFRVTRALKGGTLMRTYADGKTEKVEWKTGEVRAVEADSSPYTLKNVGKLEVVLYNVYVKETKK